MQIIEDYMASVECCHCRIVMIADEGEISGRLDRDTLFENPVTRDALAGGCKTEVSTGRGGMVWMC